MGLLLVIILSEALPLSGPKKRMSTCSELQGRMLGMCQSCLQRSMWSPGCEAAVEARWFVRWCHDTPDKSRGSLQDRVHGLLPGWSRLLGDGNRTALVEGRGEREPENCPASAGDWRTEMWRRLRSHPFRRWVSSREGAGAMGTGKADFRRLRHGPSYMCRRLGQPGVATS